jgi:hypothetical protein
MFIVLTGKVNILSAKQVILATDSAVTTIGETGRLNGETRSATVVASKHTTTLLSAADTHLEDALQSLAGEDSTQQFLCTQRSGDCLVYEALRRRGKRARVQ